MKLYVIRHGQTDLNAQRRMQARKGLPLNEVGIGQAKEASTELKDVKFVAVYSSPQERAVQTARIVAQTDRICIDDRLDAFDVGTADNQVIDENMPLLYGLVPDSRYYDGVEDTEHFRERVWNFLDELRSIYGNQDGNLLIAGHKCTTGCIDAYFNGMPANGDFFSMSSKNGKYKIYDI